MESTVANQSNRLLLVGVTAGSQPSSVTYGGQALTLLASECPSSCLTVWYLKNPPVGTATVSVSASVIGGGSTVYHNVNLSSPFGTAFTEATASTTSFSYSVSGTNTNQVVADTVFGFGTPVPGSGQTQTYLTKLSFTAVAGSRKAASSGSTSMSWSGNQASWYVVAVPIN